MLSIFLLDFLSMFHYLNTLHLCQLMQSKFNHLALSYFIMNPEDVVLLDLFFDYEDDTQATQEEAIEIERRQ